MGSDLKIQHEAKICDWLAEGKSLAAYCRSNEVGYSTVMQWLDADPTFAENYARARVNAADADADAVTDIKERMLKGEITPEQARVAIDASKWTAAKRQPKRYGDKIEANVNHSGDVRIVIGGDI